MLIFGEMYATAVAGDGHVKRKLIVLAVGGELGGGVALLRLAALYTLSQLLSNKLKFNTRVYAESSIYRIAAYGENAAKFMRFLAVCAPSAGGEYLSEKFEEFMKEARVEVRPDNIRLTKSGVAADLIISEADVAIKYNVYLSEDAIKLQFASTNRSRVELAAQLLKLAGIDAEVKKEDNRDKWYVVASTNKLAATCEEFRKAIAEIVKKAVENGWVDAGRAERWLEKLESGVTLKKGWPMYNMRLTSSGALEIRFSSPNLDSIQREAQRLRDMGLEEGSHFTVKMPEGGKAGYVYIRKEGLERAAWLSVYGSGRQQELAAEFVSYILQRAKEEGDDVYRKVEEIVKEGKARGSLTLKGFERRVEVGGREHVVKVIDGDAEIEERQDGKPLLRIRITAEVDGVKSDYTITYGRFGAINKAMGRGTARADAPGGREADAERFSVLVEALTGKRPRILKRSDGTIEVVCGRAHLEGFMRYAELADAIAKWLEKTGR